MGFDRDVLIDDMMLQAPSSSECNTRMSKGKSRFNNDDEGFHDLER
jgi:hypothetical protein